MDIKPIETYYNGYKFRSRLEARVAVFFDALGFRDSYSGRSSGTGTVMYVSESSGCWLSGAYSASGGRCLDFGSSHVSPQGWDFRSYGYTVRPVKE